MNLRVPTQGVQAIVSLSIKEVGGANLTTCFHLAPGLRNSGAIYKLPHTPSRTAQGHINLRVGRYLNIRFTETHSYR
jgi:hypothetical protein